MLAAWAPGATANEDDVYIVQTNAAGDNVHLIDPATNKIVAEITGVEVIHGVAAAPDGSRLYLSNESTHALDIVDTKTLKVRKSIRSAGGRTTSRSTRTASGSTSPSGASGAASTPSTPWRRSTSRSSASCAASTTRS